MSSPFDYPTPPLQGTFAATPLAHLLLHAMQVGLTGTLELTGRRAPAGTVLLLDGFPAKARTLEDHYLVPVLVEIGVLTKAQAEKWLPELLLGEEMHGRALIRKKVLTEEQVELGLHAQLARQMQSVVELPVDTSYKFIDGIDALAGYGAESPIRLDPLPFAWGSLRKSPPWPVVNGALSRIAGTVLKLGPGSEPGRFGFQPAERAVVELLRVRACRLEELLSTGTLSAKEVDLLVYCLLIARQLEVTAAPVVPQGRSQAPRAPMLESPTRPSIQSVRPVRVGVVREEVVVAERSTRGAFVDPRAEVDLGIPDPLPSTTPPPAGPPSAASPSERRTVPPAGGGGIREDAPDLDFPAPNQTTKPPPGVFSQEEVHTRPTVERMVAVTEDAIASYRAQQEAAARSEAVPSERAPLPVIPRIPAAPRAPVDIANAASVGSRVRTKPSATPRPAAGPPKVRDDAGYSESPETPRVDVEPGPATKRPVGEDAGSAQIVNEFDTGWDDA